MAGEGTGHVGGGRKRRCFWQENENGTASEKVGCVCVTEPRSRLYLENAGGRGRGYSNARTFGLSKTLGPSLRLSWSQGVVAARLRTDDDRGRTFGGVSRAPSRRCICLSDQKGACSIILKIQILTRSGACGRKEKWSAKEGKMEGLALLILGKKREKRGRRLTGEQKSLGNRGGPQGDGGKDRC